MDLHGHTWLAITVYFLCSSLFFVYLFHNRHGLQHPRHLVMLVVLGFCSHHDATTWIVLSVPSEPPKDRFSMRHEQKQRELSTAGSSRTQRPHENNGKVDLATALSSGLETRRMRFNPNSTMADSDTSTGCAELEALAAWNTK